MAVVGLEKTSYRVLENVSVVEVCAIVYSPIDSCPIPFAFDVRLSTIDDSAGNIHMILYSSIIHSVLYTTLVTPMDYGAVNVTLSFEACDIRRCVNVTIINDEVLEDVESLDVTLERPPGLDIRVTLLPVDGEIIITDDDGMKTFLHESYVLHFNFHTVAVVGLDETFFNVSEDVVTVELCAIIYIPNGTVNCPIAFPFTVSLSTSDFTAGIALYLMVCEGILYSTCPLLYSISNGL